MRLGKALAVGVVEETSQSTSTETIPQAAQQAARESAVGVRAQRDSEPERPKTPGRGEPVAAPPSR